MFSQTSALINFTNIAFVLIIILWFYWLWTRRHFYAFALRFPGHFGLPIIGSLYLLRHIDHVFRLSKLYLEGVDKTVCVWLGLHPCLITSDPVVIEKILTSQDCLEKAWPIYEPLHEAMMGGILTAPGFLQIYCFFNIYLHETSQKWRFYRKNLSVIFKHKTMLSFFPIFNNAKNHMIKDFQKFTDEKEHFVQEILITNTARVAFETNFDKKILEDNDECLKLVPTLVNVIKWAALQMISTSLYLHKILQKLPVFRKQMGFITKSVEIWLKQKLDEKEALNAKNIESPEDPNEEKPIIFVDQMYKLYKDQKFNWRDVVGEGVTLIIASLETTANTIYSAIVFLAMNPAVQERLFEELATIYKDKNADIKYEDYENLPYLERIIQETLRLAPAFPMIGRRFVKPFELPNGQIVPPGIQVNIMIGHLQRRKDIWGPNAENFDPDRFLSENFANVPPGAFIPFSRGPRNCIGYRYAQLVLKVMLIGLVLNFRFETDFKYEDIEIKFNISSAFVKDPGLRIYRRL